MVAPLHIAAIENTDGARLVAIADNVEARASKMGGDHGIAWYTDCHSLLENPDVDVVCVCTPSGTRGRIATEAAAAGKHVIAEKPLRSRLKRPTLQSKPVTPPG